MMVGGRIEAAIPDNTFRPERRDHGNFPSQPPTLLDKNRALRPRRFPAARKQHDRVRIQTVRLHHPCHNIWTLSREDTQGVASPIAGAGAFHGEGYVVVN